ncbi:hypothetical protein FQN51_003779 [Onygenales sp. PD_10]|nr:hypothetical protein FQN51_003779 [Onygenales sp. PD_10]
MGKNAKKRAFVMPEELQLEGVEGALMDDGHQALKPSEYRESHEYLYQEDDIINLFPHRQIQTIHIVDVVYFEDFSVRADAKEAKDYAAIYMKAHYDSRHAPRFFQAGDRVMLRLGKGYTTPMTMKYGTQVFLQM